MEINNIDISKLPADVRKEFKTLQVMHAEKKIRNKARSDFMSFVKCVWPEFAAAVYDAIIGSEMFGDYDTVRKGLDWFKQHFAKQYMVVLD